MKIWVLQCIIGTINYAQTESSEQMFNCQPTQAAATGYATLKSSVDDCVCVCVLYAVWMDIYT